MKKNANRIVDERGEKCTKELRNEVSQCKSIKESLYKAEEECRTMVETIMDGIGNVDENENFTYVNQAAADIFGYSKEELIGKNLREFISEEEFNKIINQTSSRKRQKFSKCDLSIKRKDGGIRIICVTCTPIIRSDSKYQGAYCIFHDITEQKKLQEQLLRSERLACVGTLAAGIAHEIRNPLGTISAVSQLYQSKYKLNKEQKEFLEIILRNCKDIDEVIRELIDFTNAREISLDLHDIDKVIDNILEHLYAVAMVHKVQITKNCPKGLPYVLLDERWLETAFSNCIINAFDSMPNGGILTITVLHDRKNNEILITILDTGEGISKENLDKIFDPFFTTRQNGIGLGLFLVHQIITAHNGKLDIESEVGKGTKMIVRLPISAEKENKSS